MRGGWKCTEEQEHDKLLNDDHSVCEYDSVYVCELLMCVSLSRGSPLTGGTQSTQLSFAISN